MSYQRSSSAGLEASLVACVNCSTRQLERETVTVLRGLRRVPQGPLGAEDVWAYTELHRDTYMSKEWPKIAIIVMTSAERREQRKAIRETWGEESSYPNRTVRIVFFMNMLLGKRVSNQIEAEAKEYDDLVVQPVGSPSSRSSMVTEWVPEYMPSTPLVLVLRRDDCFVNVPALLANMERLTSGRFGVAGRRAANSSHVVDGKVQGSTKREDTVTSDVEDTVGDGQLRLRAQDDGVLVNSTERRPSDLAPFDPCEVLVHDSTAFLRLQPAWPWFNTNASTADDSFFNGRLALRAGATLAHLDAFGPCDGERSSSTSMLLQSAFVTTHGLSPDNMRAMHKAMKQRARKMSGSNETALLLAKWGKALTPLRIA